MQKKILSFLFLFQICFTRALSCPEVPGLDSIVNVLNLQSENLFSLFDSASGHTRARVVQVLSNDKENKYKFLIEMNNINNGDSLFIGVQTDLIRRNGELTHKVTKYVQSPNKGEVGEFLAISLVYVDNYICEDDISNFLRFYKENRQTKAQAVLSCLESDTTHADSVILDKTIQIENMRKELKHISKIHKREVETLENSFKQKEQFYEEEIAALQQKVKELSVVKSTDQKVYGSELDELKNQVLSLKNELNRHINDKDYTLITQHDTHQEIAISNNEEQANLIINKYPTVVTYQNHDNSVPEDMQNLNPFTDIIEQPETDKPSISNNWKEVTYKKPKNKVNGFISSLTKEQVNMIDSYLLDIAIKTNNTPLSISDLDYDQLYALLEYIKKDQGNERNSVIQRSSLINSQKRMNKPSKSDGLVVRPTEFLANLMGYTQPPVTMGDLKRITLTNNQKPATPTYNQTIQGRTVVRHDYDLIGSTIN